MKKEKVYNLYIEDCHEYFANDVLVHNCDSLAMLIMISVKPMTVTPGLTILGGTRE